MKKLIITALIIGATALSAVAANNNGRKMAGDNLAEKKAEIVQHIELRISNSQAEKSCVQSAASHEELRSCREKYRPPKLNDDRSGREESRRERPNF